MRLIMNLAKTAVAAKIVEVGIRELSKPENQRKLKNGLQTVKSRFLK